MLEWDSVLIERVAYAVLICYSMGFAVGTIIKMFYGGRDA